MAPSRSSSARRPARFLAAAGAVFILVVGLAACGSSSSGSTSTATTGQQANARQGALQDPKVQACLKKQGVDLSGLRRPNGQGSNGQPPGGGSGNGGNDQTPPNGQAPPNGGFRNSAQGKKLRAALQKCGVTLPNRGQNGPPQQQQDATPSDTTAS